jgi:excisionase family DNA binding protein
VLFWEISVDSIEFYTPKQLAARLQVSARSLEKWIQQRRIPGQIRIGRVWRFRAIEVEKRLLNNDFLLDRNVTAAYKYSSHSRK